MEFHPLEIVKMTLPSLCVLYSLTCNSLGGETFFPEIFSHSDYLLQLELDVNPEGYFQRLKSSTQVFFAGQFSHHSREESVHGYRVVNGGRVFYFFNTLEGRFFAELKKGRTGCEPILDFIVHKNGKTLNRGTLRAGFCY